MPFLASVEEKWIRIAYSTHLHGNLASLGNAHLQIWIFAQYYTEAYGLVKFA